jgi:hypothetical protein
MGEIPELPDSWRNYFNVSDPNNEQCEPRAAPFNTPITWEQGFMGAYRDPTVTGFQEAHL